MNEEPGHRSSAPGGLDCLNDRDRERIRAVLCSESACFSDLVKAAGLNPASDFRFADLSYIDFRGSDIRGYDFTGAALLGASWSGAVYDDTTILTDALIETNPSNSRKVDTAGKPAGQRANVSYTFTGQQVQKLYGQKFSIRNIATNAVETIDIQPKEVFRARRGAEGYGFRAFHQHQKLGDLHAFLKVFCNDIPQRHQRSEFLVKLGLDKHHEWAFQGVPYAWLDRQNVNGVEIVGHLTKFIGLQYGQPAEDLAILKDDGRWDAYSPAERRSFAAHLASAIFALERLELVHGDLSSGDVMIGSGPEGRHICCLCDFDGFYHPSQEKLPRRFEGELTRPLGTAGYRYPELIKRASADKNDDDDNLFVESDRFALAVLICEMMVWSTDLGKKLGRAELLDEDVIVSQQLSDIPDGTKDIFSEGFALLEKALQAGSCQDMPTPDDWLRCLGRSTILIPFKTVPQVLFFRRKGSARTLYQHAVLNTETAGSFGVVHSELREITFRRDSMNQVMLAIASASPFALRRSGRQEILTEEEKKSVAIIPGDVLRIGDWEIGFEESSGGS